MPRRTEVDPLALAVGQRIRELREEAGLTIEKLAYESGLNSKGHLSSIERGLVRPTIHTLNLIADGLDVLLADLVTFPHDDDRSKLIDATRKLSPSRTKQLLRDAQR
ncbi:MAG TPA: XRE family transcriptional regulator [Polyangiaceae bacterium]|nr:XRE family transcriptional regulator [Polyangiaceae bacterium]